MQSIGGLSCLALALLVCTAQADTLPTLTATNANIYWYEDVDQYSTISGADFGFYSLSPGVPGGITYPCSLPLPAGGCVAPGPPLFFQEFGPNGNVEGGITLGGTGYPAVFVGNAQIQYLTPTIVYPDPTIYPPVGVTIPVVLSGSETAYLQTYPPFSTPVANISINLPGTLTLTSFLNGPNNNMVATFARFNSTPVPEPESIALACIGLFALAAAYRMRKGRILS